jgi:tricorn protease
MNHRLSVFALLALLPATALAQGTRLLREPTISASQIAFAYGNDLWVVGRTGGDARRLTSFPGTETSPFFSPDGKTIAFTASYGGNEDVWVIASDGGEPRRLTWHPGGDEVRGWTPDGTRIVFATTRDAAPGGQPRLWTVPVAGGTETPLPMQSAVEASFSPDGKRIAYQHIVRWQRHWRNYRGGQALPIWILDLADYKLAKIPGPVSNNDSPVWLGNTIYFLSDRDLAMNVYAYDVTSGQVRQVTHHKDLDVKALAGGSGGLVYEQAGYLHLLDPATGQAKQLEITAKGDFPWAMPRWVDLGKQLSNGSLSPTGQRALFEARGEIVTIPTGKGDARNLTRSSGTADRAPAWSPDGKRIAWFSDASGEYRLMIGDQDGQAKPREITVPNPTFFYDLSWAPDGQRLSFTDSGRNLYVVDVGTGKVTRADGDTYAHPEHTLNPVWSPDSKYLAYAKRLETQYLALMIYSVADGRTHQITDGMADARWPAWDASGKYLWFLASTELGLASEWLSMSYYEKHVNYGVYLAVLAKDAPSPLLPESDEEAAKDTAKAATEKAGTEKPKADAAKDSVTVRIDFDGLQQRVVPIGLPLRTYTSLRSGAAGIIFLTEAVENQPGQTLHRYDLAKRAAKPFLGGVQNYSLSKDGKKLLYQSMGAWGVVATDGEAKPGDGKLATEVNAWNDPKAEWHQIFREAWRYQRDYLYVKNLHGADWDRIWQTYGPMVDDVVHRSDLNHLLVLIGGELSIGHSFVFGGDEPEVKPVPVGLLGADVAEESGRYRIARIYSGESWNPDLKAPLAVPGVNVSQGDYILEVNGVDVKAPQNFYRFFEGTVGRQTVLRVNTTPVLEGSRVVTVVPVSPGAEQTLRIAAWVEGNRHFVDSASGGKLAYVWLPNTAEDGYVNFNRYYFAQQDRPGAIVDERFNGGGSVADYFISVMTRPLYGFFNNPVGERKPWTSPEAGIWGPKVMLANESAGSGGDMLPYMFKQQKVGTLVGTRTWGGLVGIWDVPGLIDGGYMTAPRGGFFNLNGEWDVENIGVTPDIEVEQTPKETIAGRDPQLEAAVREAMKQLSTWKSPLKPEPAGPVRVRRPN